MKIVEIELQPGGVGARHGAWSLDGGTGAADDDASDDAREDASGVLVNRIVGQVPLCTFERSGPGSILKLASFILQNRFDFQVPKCKDRAKWDVKSMFMS